MDVKFITVAKETLDEVPIIDGQIIALYDDTGYYYDMDSIRHIVSTTVTATTIKEIKNPQPGMLYLITDEANKGVYVYQDGKWLLLGTTYDIFIGATKSSDGSEGLVPSPKISERKKYLRGDAKWSYTPYPQWNGDYEGEDQPEPTDDVDVIVTPDSINPVASSTLYDELLHKQDQHISHQYSLLQSDWNISDKTQTLAIESVSTNDSVFISPADDYIDDYISANLRCIKQNDNNLVFKVKNLPARDIVLNIAILGYRQIAEKLSASLGLPIETVQSSPIQQIVMSALSQDVQPDPSKYDLTLGDGGNYKIDTEITADSKNPVTSSAIFAALALKQNLQSQQAITLSKDLWDSTTRKIIVNVDDMVTENSVFVAPSIESFDKYLRYGVKCIKQATNKLTFDCSEIPDSDLNVNIMILQ